MIADLQKRFDITILSRNFEKSNLGLVFIIIIFNHNIPCHAQMVLEE